MKTRQELKKAYKQTTPTSGVFQVTNEANGMILLEAAKNVHAKWNRHRTELRFGSHRNKKLQQDWNKLGEENFKFSILSVLKVEADKLVDLNSEVALLKEMVEEELQIMEAMKY